MTDSPRESALASRHRALGSGLEDWNGMGTAWTYDSDPNDEHDAVREAAGLFDMSPLKKVYLRGPDAERVADHVISRDLTRVAPGQSVYGAVLTEQGTVCDDAIVANNGTDEWLFCHGGGASMERIQDSAEGRNIDVEFDDDLHTISLQGPKALGLLNRHLAEDLSDLSYFHHRRSQLFGHSCQISRTGYSGERGYEIMADRSVICDIWDNILGEGAEDQVMPCSFTALDKVRVEAALLFFGYDMNEDHTPWEVGLGFTINRSGGDYRGKEAALAAKGTERFRLAGLSAALDDALPGGETLLFEGIEVGTVNSPAWSQRLGKSLALVHVRPDIAPGTELEIIGEDTSCTGIVAAIPFFDPGKTRTHL